MILGAGKAITWDGVRAAPLIAKQIMDRVRFLQNAEEKEHQQNVDRDSKPEKRSPDSGSGSL